MFEPTSEPRNQLSDRVMRGAIAAFYLWAGADKFGAAWIEFYQRIGIGQWFRCATGAIEILGGILVLIPATIRAGIALLVCTMGAAVLIVTVVMHRPLDAVFPGVFFVTLLIFWWNRGWVRDN